MKTLRVELITDTDNVWATLRYWLPDVHHPETRQLQLAEIQPLIQTGELYYDTTRPDLVRVGQQLFDWLDGNGRWLQRAVDTAPPPGLVLAINVDASLAHLPWEVLHNGKSFLVERIGTPVVPVRWLNLPTATPVLKEESLRVLFMATAPDDVQPVLDFEREEAEILRFMAEEEVPLTLRVEESGCVKEMGKLWRKYADGTFDVFHLTGHASIREGRPFFITESETGTREESTAEEIFRAMSARLPRLVFLSGCRTAQADNQGEVASLAEALARLGLPAVLGWGQPVYDISATVAAAQLYQRLAAGFSLGEALSETYRYLREENIPDWHLLRLYTRDIDLAPLAPPPGDYVPAGSAPQDQFLDRENKVRVATPAQFVGRRRLLQRCLRHLRQRQCLGLMLHGLGGNGKSTVAARLLERLEGYEPLVIYQRFDLEELMRLLALQCASAIGQEILNGPLPTVQKLAKFLKDGLNDSSQRFCFVLDDFEANLESDNNGSQKLKAAVVKPLNDLLNAINQSQKPHKVIFTSRYKVTLPEQNHRIERESVPVLGGADLAKKYRRLEAFQPQSTIDHDLQNRAKAVANGNPRLLEWLDQVLQDDETDQVSILDRMAETEVKFRESILAETLLAQQTESLKQMLGQLLVYALPVPEAAVDNLCGGIDQLADHQQRALSLGLLEQSIVNNEAHYRVPRILQPLLPDAATDEVLRAAARVLYELWWEKSDATTEEGALEIHRVSLLAGDKEIATQLNAIITNRWRQQSRYRDVVDLCKQTLELAGDNGLAHFNLADAERILGNTKTALKHYQESLALNETIGDVQGKSATLHEMANIYLQQGQVEQAMGLYQESLALKETIGDVQGKSATLANIAYLVGEQGDTEQQFQLYRQAAQGLSQIGAWPDLVTVLGNLFGCVPNQKERYLAQAVWLGLFVQLSLNNWITYLNTLFNTVPQGDDLEPLLAATACLYCARAGSEHPQQAQLQELSLKMLAGAAGLRGIETEVGLQTWMQQEKLNEPDSFLPRLNEKLITLIGDSWLFDPQRVMGERHD